MHVAGFNPILGMWCRTFETPAQADMRRAAERARLIAEMEAEDAAEGVR